MSSIWNWIWSFVLNNWGSVASVIGLILSAFTLVAARKAKSAADAAKKEIHRRNLAEDLQEVRTKSEQVGIFIRDGKWDRVYIRAQEISGACSVVLSRWQRNLTAESKANITLARDQAGSIAKAAMRADRNPLTALQITNLSASHARVHEVLSTELGQSLGAIEGS